MSRTILPQPYRGACELAGNALRRAVGATDVADVMADLTAAELHIARARRFAAQYAATERPDACKLWSAEEAESIEAFAKAVQ